jgi:hypothetical protein
MRKLNLVNPGCGQAKRERSTALSRLHDHHPDHDPAGEGKKRAYLPTITVPRYHPNDVALHKAV